MLQSLRTSLQPALHFSSTYNLASAVNIVTLTHLFVNIIYLPQIFKKTEFETETVSKKKDSFIILYPVNYRFWTWQLKWNYTSFST